MLTCIWVDWKTDLFTVHSGIIILLTGSVSSMIYIFLIWKGDSYSLNAFMEHLNNVVPCIKFTHEISSTSVNILDTKVMKDSNDNISTDVCQKPTETHPYLHWTSAHPPHLKHSVPYTQALRLRRICTSTNVLEQRIREYSEYFVACGCKRNKVTTEMNKVLRLTQEESLQPREKGTDNWIPLVTTYNPHTLTFSTQ